MTLKPCVIALVVAVMFFGGCRTSHEVEVKPVEIKPIHITIDVNVKVQKALDDFFGEIDAQEEKIMEKLETQDEK
jgi:hypothetical protein